jgi:hypothetical protein
MSGLRMSDRVVVARDLAALRLGGFTCLAGGLDPRVR